MAVSRPFLLALLGAVLVAALYLVTMAGRGSTEDSGQSSPPPQEAAKPSKPAAKPEKPAAKAKDRAVAAATPAEAKAKEPAKPAADARAKEQRKLAASAGVPLDVLRALAKKRTVGLFFRQRGAADDEATAQAVASVRGTRGVTLFSEPISRLSKYRTIVDAAGVTQAPAVVVIGRKGARLVEGFVDRETLAQEVADSR